MILVELYVPRAQNRISHTARGSGGG
jgi:hypothetical protein